MSHPRPPPVTMVVPNRTPNPPKFQKKPTSVAKPWRSGGIMKAWHRTCNIIFRSQQSSSQYDDVTSCLHFNSDSPFASLVLRSPDHDSGIRRIHQLARVAQEFRSHFNRASGHQLEYWGVNELRVGFVEMGEEDVKFVELSDGRRIAYREQGLGKEVATRSLLVLHGLGSSRLAGMPGVSESLLKEMGVRLVSIDRPGYGGSDFNAKQTFETAAKDVAQVADILELGQKIWLLGYSCGGAYCWAAARYIPERIAGIAMWAPVGNYYWKGISESERTKLMGTVTARSRSVYGVLGKLPHWMFYAYVRFFIIPSTGSKWVEDAKKRLSPPDVQYLEGKSGPMMERDSIESGKQKGKGMAQDLLLISSAWGFELSDVQDVYQGSIHIFHGDQDNLVPVGLQACIKKVVPDLVHLHALEGEGHLSAFCYNDKIHRETLECLFGGGETIGEIGKANELDMKIGVQ